MKAKAYTFRVLLDSEGEAYRDIEISSDSTFKDLHLAIVDAVKFDGNELASFYICDDNWKRETEIALMEMDDVLAVEEEEEEEMEEFDEEEENDMDGDEEEDHKGKKSSKKSPLRKVEDEDEPKKGKKSKKEKILVMSERKLSDHLAKTTQKLIYIYDYYELWTFYIELSKVEELDPKVKYPRCTKKVGKLPEKSTTDVGFDDDELEMEGLEEFSSSKKKGKSKDPDEDFDDGFDDDFEDDSEFEDGYDDEDLDRFSKYN